jgi:preprotein translocase subunit SecF
VAGLAPAQADPDLSFAMLRPVHILKSVPKLDFFRFHKLCFALSAALCLISVVSLSVRGLNYGVDFAGGILIELRTPEKPDLAVIGTSSMRSISATSRCRSSARPTTF